MSIKRVIAAAAGGIMLAITGVAVAANMGSSRQSDFFSPGKHQFYVWCAGGTDYMALRDGRSAEDAQMKLYNEVKAAGHASCWPVWQRRISG
ncbi:MAG: hypothetical protein JOZ55_12400 [Alphaproteobacteria bacterium]|nr:hypothetical protein [Alphaproteobacteria bacterium]